MDDGEPEAVHAFEHLVGSLDPPVVIVTTVGADGARAGCLVGFTMQCSIHPARYLVGISVLNHTHRVAATAELLAVHLVPRAAAPLAQLFGGETGDEVDKFARCAWTAGPGEVPLLDDCPDRFVGRILDRVPQLGDHTGYVLAPVEAQGQAGDHLTLRAVRQIAAGHPE